MKKINIIVLICCAFFLSLVIPTGFWIKDYFTSYKDSINSSVLADYSSFQSFIIAIWSLILNGILVILAHKAYKNFDVKKQFHNKQLEIVSELATSISSLELSNMMYKISSGSQIATGFRFSFFEIALGFDYSDFDFICVKSNNIENTFPFLKYRNHPLLPKTISDELQKLYRPFKSFISKNKDELKTKNYVLIYGGEKLEDNDISADWIYELYKTPPDFTKDVTSLRESIIKWYKDYEADNLNI